MPVATKKVASLGLAMSQRTSAPLFGTFAGTWRRTLKLDPSQLKAVSRVEVTEFWKPASIRISTNWRVGSCAGVGSRAPDITSSMSAMWKAARAGGAASLASSTAIRNHMTPIPRGTASMPLPTLVRQYDLARAPQHSDRRDFARGANSLGSQGRINMSGRAVLVQKKEAGARPQPPGAARRSASAAGNYDAKRQEVET